MQVFTDDFSSCLEKLKIQLKTCVENRKHMGPVVKMREDDALYQNMIQERLKNLHIALKRFIYVLFLSKLVLFV